MNQPCCSSAMPSSKNDQLEVYKITSGKSSFAHGAFGQVSIALGVIAERETRRFSITYLAVKDIRNAIQIKHGSSKQSISTIVHPFNYGNSDPLDPNELLLHKFNESESESDSIHDYEFTKDGFCELASLRLLSGENHPCITQLLTIAESDHDPLSLSLVFPYGLMDLASVVENQRKSFNLCTKFIHESLLKTIMGDILSALDFCHSKGILHRDIKPGNFVIGQNGHVQLTDFGLAKPYTQCMSTDAKNLSCIHDHTNNRSAPRSNAQCTLHYRPPELLFNSEHYGYEADIWGCGLVLAELINLRPLFPGRTVLDQIGRIFYVMGTPNEENWSDAERLDDFRKFCFKPQAGIGLLRAIPRLYGHSMLSEFLMNMLSLDPRKRPSASNCRTHPWLYNSPSPSSSSHLLKYLIPHKLQISKSWLDTVPFDEEQNLSLVLEHHFGRAVNLAAARRNVASSNLITVDGQESINFSQLAELLTKVRLAQS